MYPLVLMVPMVMPIKSVNLVLALLVWVVPLSVLVVLILISCKVPLVWPLVERVLMIMVLMCVPCVTLTVLLVKVPPPTVLLAVVPHLS